MNYAKLLEINSFFTLYIFLEVGKTQDMPSKIWQTLRDALTSGTLREKQNYIYALPPFENLNQEPFSVIFFSPSHLTRNRDANRAPRAYICALEAGFSQVAKNC